MSEEIARKTFTFFWSIENIDILFKSKHISSPLFQVGSSDRTFWYLSIWTENLRGFTEICVWSTPVQGDDDEPDESKFEYEISLLSPDGIELTTVMGRIYKGFACCDFLKSDQLYYIRNACSLDNLFVIRCKIWKSGLGFESSSFCSGRTVLTKEKGTTFWPVRRLSSLNSGEKRSRCVKLNLQSFPLVTLNLLLMERSDEIQLEITSNYSKTELKSFWKVSVLDIFGELLKSRHVWWDMTEKKSSCNFPCFMTISELMANKAIYLTNDTLILRFDYEMAQRRQMIVDTRRTKSLELDNQEFDSKGLIHINRRNESLRKDLAHLYKEGLFSDVILQVGSEKFPAHKSILCARSPVFKAMFTLDMKEKEERCIELKEIEPDTLKRLLFYMYTDTIEDLLYEDAAALYTAADKYDLVALRKKCSAILKTKLSIFNTCELLVLADMHSDEDLKSHVASFFKENYFKITLSASWEHLLKNHFNLALEIMDCFTLQTK